MSIAMAFVSVLEEQLFARFAPNSGTAQCSDGASIYYEVYGTSGRTEQNQDTRPKVVLIMGLACGCRGWRWQLSGLLQPSASQSNNGNLELPESPLVACIIDNRGVGRSSAPSSKKQYSTLRMADDVICVMDQLGWESAHIVGFSMGGMIACKLAAHNPQRVGSLTVISATQGGWQIIPWSPRGLATLVKQLASRDPESRADADVHFHFSLRTLRQRVSFGQARTRREALRREYMLSSQGGDTQSPDGFKGQVHACWTHRLERKEARTIRTSGFPTLVMHGRHDLLASPQYGERLAARLGASCVLMEGAHFIPRECAPQVNALLRQSIMAGVWPLPHSDDAPHLDPHHAPSQHV